MDGDRVNAVLLAGPTASGKSALAIALATRFNGVVINADSMQVYRDLAVITARPTADEMTMAPHRLYGHVDGAVNHSVGRWLPEASACLSEAKTTGHLPIIIGGTGLYFKALERGLARMPTVPVEIRERIRREAEGETPQLLHERLARVDPQSAARLRPTDPQRLLRALEVHAATGRSLTEWQGEPHSPPLVDASRCLRLFLAPDRALLHVRINNRFDRMIETGAIEEVRALHERALDPALPVMRAHGVPWLCKALGGAMPLAAAVDHAKADTRHYAKRQFTWFRNQMPGWTFADPAEALSLATSRLAR